MYRLHLTKSHAIENKTTHPTATDEIGAGAAAGAGAGVDAGLKYIIGKKHIA